MKKCPLTQKKCWEHSCEWYVHLVGMNPQTAQPQDEWGCAVRWLPILSVENSNMSRQVAKSVDEHKNVFVRAMPPMVQQRIAAGQKPPALNGGNGNP